MQLNLSLPPFLALTLGALLAAFAPPAQAQNLFAPAITVDDIVISRWELDQRIRFLEVLRAPGDPEEQAPKALIEDRLRARAAAEAGIAVSEEQLRAGIEEFAARTQLSAEQFLAALQQEGIAPETLRDFVRTGLAWREYIRVRFLPQARPNRAEIQRAMAEDSSRQGVRVNLAEVIIPLTPQTADQVEALAEEIAALKSYAEFSEAAERFSASNTRDRGGQLGWVALSTLPVPLQPQIIALNPGETTPPIVLPNAIAVFQMRGIEELTVPPPRYAAIDYAAYLIPGGRSPEALATAAQVRARVDTCDDLFGLAKGQPAAVLERESVAPSALPRDYALELAKLDPGEHSTALTRANGQTLVFLMLCGRTASANAEATEDDIGAALTQRNLQRLSEGHLAQLRANALILEQ